jgi:hypothetical protein
MKMNAIIPLFVVVTVACALPVLANAETDALPAHYSGGLGFHNINAPLGGRWWFGGQKIGLDFGVGFASTPAPSYDEKLTDWAFEVGVPIVMKNWEKVHMLFRPGFMYESQEQQTSNPPNPFTSDNQTKVSVTAEIEAEIFIVNNFSVSASEGIGFFSESPAGGGGSVSSIGTIGNNFSHIGFHIYFFGGKPN